MPHGFVDRKGTNLVELKFIYILDGSFPFNSFKLAAENCLLEV